MANTKQSNKQTQSVKVVVNNKIACCDDKKKKRKPKKKQQPQEQQPLDEFPVLNTPANSHYPIAGISPIAVRNQVYIPSAMQISPEGATQPIPAYFDRHYTNLVRTMEDFKTSMMNEMQDVRNLVSIQPKQTSSMSTQTVSDTETQTDPLFDEQQGFGSPTYETPKMSKQPSFAQLDGNITPALTTPTSTMDYEAYAPLDTFLYQTNLNDMFSPEVKEQGTSPLQVEAKDSQNATSKLELGILNLPSYANKFYEAVDKGDEKMQKEMFKKIKKVGNELGLIETRGRGITMEDTVRRVEAAAIAKKIELFGN